MRTVYFMNNLPVSFEPWHNLTLGSGCEHEIAGDLSRKWEMYCSKNILTSIPIVIIRVEINCHFCRSKWKKLTWSMR